MGSILQPPSVKLFVGILTSQPELFDVVESRLAASFGAVDLRSDRFPFDQTDYYEREMGASIERQFLALETLIAADALAGIKVETNRLEAELAGLGGLARPVNLDPGYLEQAKVVLASTKNFYHRIQLRDGIYGEVTLHWEGGEWRPFHWTFPDFRSGRYFEFFAALRARYRAQLRQSCLVRRT
jgi:hypothetical protein